MSMAPGGVICQGIAEAGVALTLLGIALIVLGRRE